MEVNIKIVENDQEKELVLSTRKIVFIEELNIPEVQGSMKWELRIKR